MEYSWAVLRKILNTEAQSFLLKLKGHKTSYYSVSSENLKIYPLCLSVSVFIIFNF